MKFKLLILILLISFGLNFPAKNLKKTKSAIEATVKDFAREHRFSGSILVAKGNSVIYKKGVGYANHTFGIANTADHVFLVGSISKQFASMIILQLIDEGKIKFEDPIGKWFPKFPKYKVEKITIHHLLSHSSGLPHYRGLVEIGIDLDTYDRVNRPLEAYAKTIGIMNLKWAPGTKMSYSSQGYILLGIIAQKVTGKTLNQLIQSRISKPLGLKNTGFAYNSTIVKNLAPAYNYGVWQRDDKSLRMGYRNARYRDQTNTFCTGGIHSTVGDLFKWSQALLSYKLLKKELQDKMMTVQAEPYGYGLFITKGENWGLGKNITIINHGGATTGYRAQIAMIDRGTYTIILLGNSDISRAGALSKSIANILYGKKATPANILGTAIAWRLVSDGEIAAFKMFEKNKAEGFKRYLHNDYAYHVYADRFLKLEQPELSMKLIKIGLLHYPNSGLLHLTLGDILTKQNHLGKAQSEYIKAIELAEKNPKENSGVKNRATSKLKKFKKAS